MYRIPVIKVKNNETGKTHIVGLDKHDALSIDENGGIQYENLQTCETTEKGFQENENDGYTFEAKDYEDFGRQYIEFVTLEEFIAMVNPGFDFKPITEPPVGEPEEVSPPASPVIYSEKQLLLSVGDCIDCLKWKIDEETENEIYQATITKVSATDITVSTKDFYGVDIAFADILNWDEL